MRAIAPRALALLLVVSSFAVRPAHATEPFAKVRTYAASWLSFPRGVRNIGMGGTGTADVTGLATGYFNPATLAWSSATTLVGSYEALYFDTNISELVVTSPIPFRADSTDSGWHFGGSFGYSHLGMAPQTDRTIFLPEGTGRTFDASDWILSATGAASWTFRDLTMGAGSTARYLRSNFGSGHADGWVFDVGAVMALPIDLGEVLFRPRLGYSALNLDSGIEYDGRTSNVPTDKRFGGGFDVEALPVRVANRLVPAFALAIDYDDIDRETTTSVDHAAGFEVSFLNALYFRYGGTDDSWDMWGLGAGWDYGNVLFRVDYAHAEPQNPFLVDLLGSDAKRDTFGALVGVRW
jgi:hypothetical protein